MATKLKSEEITMTFSEAMDALLDGNKIRHIYWEDDNYIMLDSNGDIVNKFGNIYIINKTDLMGSWELCQPKVTVGTLLSYYGSRYRIVFNKKGKLDIVNTKTWGVFIGDIHMDKIDDTIKSLGMEVINDGSID